MFDQKRVIGKFSSESGNVVVLSDHIDFVIKSESIEFLVLKLNHPQRIKNTSASSSS